MRILLVSSAFSGLTQRFYTELKSAGYHVSVELHFGDEQQLREGVGLFKPDLIVCPYLTKRIPEDIYNAYKCLIVHPGVRGDRGPSSLDWAIQQGLMHWGVTLLEAAEEMDAGDIWAYREFPMRATTKSSLFNGEVTQAAVECLWEAITYFQCSSFKPQPLDYSNPEIKGQLRPLMKQTDRAIDWKKHCTDEIVRRIRAADGSPGLLDTIQGQPYYLFNAHPASNLKGKPGQIIAIADGAIARATIDGAVWIGHLQAKTESGKGIKLPATVALSSAGIELKNHSFMGLKRPIMNFDSDREQAGRQLPFQEIWFEIKNDAAYLYFEFHNGGMGTRQCERLLQVYRYLAGQHLKAIVLMGGNDFWSNGIHLNHIENANSPADESWKNINAIDNLIYQIINTPDKLTISAIRGNAGAGGVILALAADLVYAREGVVLNPHYKNMGGLFGSEYWTYLLPKRVGISRAVQLTEQCLPLSAKQARELGLIDRVLDSQSDLLMGQVEHLTQMLCENASEYQKCLNQKARVRCSDEAEKPLQAYRMFELIRMHANFYQQVDYHQARQQFVYKKTANTDTPLNIATHRCMEPLGIRDKNWAKFIWHDVYQLHTEQVDTEHQHIYALANELNDTQNFSELHQRFAMFKTMVEQHFKGEEKVLFRSQGTVLNQPHFQEHKTLLDLLVDIETDIQSQQWQVQKLDQFMAALGKHIIDVDQEISVKPVFM